MASPALPLSAELRGVGPAEPATSEHDDARSSSGAKIKNSQPPISSDDASYGVAFWHAYASNTLLMVAISLLFRYADLVTHLGGNEWHLGWITGLGMVGSLATRLFLGVGIDRYGARLVWIVSTTLFAATCFAHLWVTRIDTPLVFALQILYRSGIAGFFGASITFVSRRASLPRIAEVVGTLGTSGFIGLMVGPALADALCGTGPVDRGDLVLLFSLAGALGLGSTLFGYLATRGDAPAPPSRRQPMFWLLRKYHPGLILPVAAIMGFGLGMPGIFLRAYAQEQQFAGTWLFFAIYTPVAFITRMSIRRMPERVGVRPMIHIGVAALTAAVLLYWPVVAEWLLVFPAVCLGIAHAVLFPAVIAAGAAAFPDRHRGLGTTLILAMMDIGALVGAPLAGGTLRAARWLDWPAYPTMFIAVAAVFALIGLLYAARDESATSQAN